MSQVDVPLTGEHFGQTARRDNWWAQPLAVFLALSGFIVYSTWAALQGAHLKRASRETSLAFTSRRTRHGFPASRSRLRCTWT